MENNLNNQPALSKEQIDSVISLYSSGKLSEAINTIKSLNELYPNVPLLFNILGACYKAQGSLEESVKIFKIAIAFEIDKNSRNILSKNAIINKVRKRISIYSEANFSSLKNNLKKKDLNKTLFLLDIEGNEFDLFDLDFCKYFSQSYFIVEDHSFLIINKKKN